MKTVGEIADLLSDRNHDASDLVPDLRDAQARTGRMHDLLDELNIPQVLETDEDGTLTSAVGRLEIAARELKELRGNLEALQNVVAAQGNREVVGFFVKKGDQYLQVRASHAKWLETGERPDEALNVSTWGDREAACLYLDDNNGHFFAAMEAAMTEGARVVKVTRRVRG